MSVDLHPHRYQARFGQALASVEKIVSDPASTKAILEAQYAIPPKLKTFCDRATAHLNNLVSQWDRGGRVAYEIEDLVMSANGQLFGKSGQLGLAAETVFLKMRLRHPHLELTKKGIFIEGCYLHGLPDTGEIELTFTCQEPGWDRLPTMSYPEALATVSLIAIGRVPTADIETSMRGAYVYAGMEPLFSDPSLKTAMSLAVSVLPALSPTARVSPQQVMTS